MNRKSSSESGFFNLRIFAAFVLCAIGTSLAMLSFAATPPSGTLTDTSGQITYTAGPFFIPNAFGNTIPGICDPDPADPLAPCDIYKLTVTLPAGYETTNPNRSVFVRIEWPTPAADFDLYLWNASNWSEGDSFPTGDPIASSFQQATNFEQVEIPATGGTRQLVVSVSTTLPAGQSFTGKIFLGPTSQASVPVQPPGNAAGIPPRFELYHPSDASGAPSTSLGIFAAEPTIFGNPMTGNIFFIATYEVLRGTFDDSTSPAKVTWQPKDRPTNISNHVTLDPLLLGDPTPHGSPPRHRLWAMQLTGGQSSTDISDDDGETWTPVLSGGFGSGADHQGIGVGPYPTSGPGSMIPHPLYPNAVYYCSQDVATAFCSRSDDGGMTYGPIVPVYDSVTSRCIGLHGHPKIGPDGTVYVPNKGCGLDVPVIGQGRVTAVVSKDAGITWQIKSVPDSTGDLSTNDPSIAVDKAGKAYLAYQNLANNNLYVATTTNQGDTWTASVDVGALAGVNYSVFPAVAAGDAGRAAVAFFGSPYNGPNTDYESMSFPGVWYLYVATTYDGGNTWFVTNTTPDHPIQGAFAGIASGGDNRNHYDFIDCEIDGEGRIIVPTSIGCIGSCPQNGGPNSFTTLGAVVRQSGGRRMLAAFDPVEPATPQPPLLNGYRTSQFVSLTWPEADGSGLPITGYNVYRSIDGGPEAKILGPTPTRQLVDPADSAKTYSYRVTALNSQGESGPSNAFAPTVGQNAPRPELSCSLPGQLYTDRTGEGGAFPNNDIASFGIAEPASMPGKLVFVVNNAQPEAVAGSQSEFYILFDLPDGSRTLRLALTDMNGTSAGVGTGGVADVADYKNGQFVSTCGTAMLDDCRDWKVVGQLDAGSGVQADGSVRFIIDKAQYGIKKGDALLGIQIREDTAQNPSRIITTDYAGYRQNYLVVGNDYCATNAPVPLRVVSRKSHKDVGAFDVWLPLVGTPGIEPRRGGASNDYTVVFSFPKTLTSVGGASVASGNGSVSSSNIDSSDAHNYIVNLTGVTSGQTIQIKLSAVNDGTNTGDLTAPMSVLVGDTNGDRSVNSGDAQQTRNRSGQVADATNFRSDVNTDGNINSGDAFIVRDNSGQGL